MNINPNILLGIGLFFALLYACVITFGWVKTRRNRHHLQLDKATSLISTLVLDSTIENPPQKVRTISLPNNLFIDSEGRQINIQAYTPYIAVGESDRFPHIQNGDLILKDNNGDISYVFSIPNLKDYR